MTFGEGGREHETQTDISLVEVQAAVERMWQQWARDRRELLQLRNYPAARLDLASTQQLLDELAARYAAKAREVCEHQTDMAF